MLSQHWWWVFQNDGLTLINITAVLTSHTGSVRVWDIRKGSSHAGLLSLDWRQDHTTRAGVDHSQIVVTHNNNSTNSSSSSSRHIKHFSTETYGTASTSGSSRNRAMLCKAHNAEVMAMRYTPDGNYILTAGRSTPTQFNDIMMILWYIVACLFVLTLISLSPLELSLLHALYFCR